MRSAYDYCIYLLSRQDYSEFKLRQKLRQRQTETEEINQTITKLKEKNFLNEERYKQLFIKKWILRGEGKQKIRLRAEQEKLTISESDFDHYSPEKNIEKLIIKKTKNLNSSMDKEESFKQKSKLLRYLVSKGHSYQEAKKMVDQEWKNLGQTQTEFDQDDF